MLKKEVAALLEQQINKEFYSAYLYLDMSNYYYSCLLYTSNQIRQHPIEVGADSQVRQQVNPVPVDINAGIAGRDTLKQAEQERGPSNVQRFPVAENHNRQG